MKKGFVLFIFVIFLFSGFSGCAKKSVKTAVEGGALEKGEAAGSRPLEEVPVTAEGVPAGKAGEEAAFAKVEEMAAAKKAFEGVTEGIEDVYFDFDRYDVTPGARAALDKNAGVLKKNGKMRVLIEGHADERGTSEYNLALGESRAAAVKRYLADLGVGSGRMSIVSYGEEKPFCSEKTEECWQKNRRAHFVVTD
ncbi:MAG: peptidoglycan-associated lipoprotein Pal [Deltaproteobacteria bacterium]|nr:peptidoglycan-associated lipoprotein Pal [Deltaproteobacteria bacterium]